MISDLPYKSNKNEKVEYKLLTLFIMMFLCIFIICEMTTFLMVDFFHYKIPFSAFIIPIIYLLSDLIAEVYGYREIKKIIWNGLLVQLLFVLTLAFITKIKFISFSENIISYREVFDNIFRANLAGCLSIISGMFLNAFIISKLKLNMNGRMYWVRALLSSYVSGYIATFIAFSIILFNSMNFRNIIELSIIISFYKLFFAILTVPILSLITRKIKQIEKIDRYDYGINYNPFKF